ncbi:MAG: alpha/beta hydrolase [Pseudomonadota bacterium]|nr:alpha/beta hydrolase [Pseudomonadota bacterium]
MHVRKATFAALLSMSIGTAAASNAVIPIEQVGKAYTQAHRLVDVGQGRRMNLYCQGQGDITVVFDSGLSDWSSTWALVQPAVATRTRACSYDRAGMGYSDASPRPGSPANIVEDLHTLLQRAGISGKRVLVGHSLGGFNMKLYAATYPSEVAGMVLVDPSEDRTWKRVGVAMEARFGSKLIAEREADDSKSLAEANAQFAECVRAAQAGTLAATTAMYAECTDPPRAQLGPDILAERSVLQPRLPYQSAQASELLHSVYGPDTTPDAHYAGLFDKPRALGDLPLIVLTAGLFDMSPPFGELNYYSWTALHAQTAAMSSRGTQRMVPRSRHNIQVEQPQAIVDAVGEVLDMIATPAATAP